MFKHKQRVLAVLCSLMGTQLQAQMVVAPDDDLLQLYGSEEMISIATGTQKPIHLAPAVASIVTAADIKAMGVTSLDEALELIPGLHVSVSNINRLNSVYSIRGIHTGSNAQVLLTINGIPLKNSYTGSRLNTFRLPVANISRIEVIRGPGSAVHGADAFAGVINVVTKDAKDAKELKGIMAGGRAGSFDSQESWLQYGGRAADWDVSFSLEHAISDGDHGRKVESDAATVLGTSFAPAVPLQSRYNILNTRIGMANDDWDISLWSWMQRDGGTGPGIAQAIDPVGGAEIDYFQLDVNYRSPVELNGWAMGSRLNIQYENEKNRYLLLPPGSVVPVGDDGNIGTTPNSGCPTVTGLGKACLVNFIDGLYGNPGGKYNTGGFEVNALYDKQQNHLVRLSLGFSQQRITANETKNFGPGTPTALVGETAADPSGIWFISGALTEVTGTADVFIADQTRNVWYLAFQDEWQFAPDWELTGGVRYDHYTEFGSTVNPRLALVWAMDYNLTSKLLLGSAFRAPSFSEEFAKNNPVVLGNSKLRPETINTAEVAFDYRPNFDLQEMFNLFYYEAKDLIDYGMTAVGAQAQNLNSQKGYGLEMESKWKPLDSLTLGAAFAWQHSEDMRTGEPIADAPGRQLSLSLLWKVQPAWSMYGSANWVADRKRAANDSRPQIDDYTVVNLTLRRHLGQQWELAASLRNLLDEDAREPSSGAMPNDYPLEGRSLYAEVRYKLAN